MSRASPARREDHNSDSRLAGTGAGNSGRCCCGVKVRRVSRSDGGVKRSAWRSACRLTGHRAIQETDRTSKKAALLRGARPYFWALRRAKKSSRGFFDRVLDFFGGEGADSNFAVTRNEWSRGGSYTALCAAVLISPCLCCSRECECVGLKFRRTWMVKLLRAVADICSLPRASRCRHWAGRIHETWEDGSSARQAGAVHGPRGGWQRRRRQEAA